MNNQELWRDVPGYEGLYQVSDQGRVKSFIKGERLLHLQKTTNGYTQVYLCKDGVTKHCRVHVLVASAFIGERLPNYHVHHINAVRLDNRVSNLCYMPASQHLSESTAQRNRMYSGEKHYLSKLTDKQRCEIRMLHASGVLTHKIATQYGISKRLVRDLVAGARGKHVDCSEFAGRAALAADTRTDGGS